MHCFMKSLAFFHIQGEELLKLIGATCYIECSSKTQQVCLFLEILYCFDIDSVHFIVSLPTDVLSKFLLEINNLVLIQL
jgi:hypothetical protein